MSITGTDTQVEDHIIHTLKCVPSKGKHGVRMHKFRRVFGYYYRNDPRKHLNALIARGAVAAMRVTRTDGYSQGEELLAIPERLAEQENLMLYHSSKVPNWCRKTTIRSWLAVRQETHQVAASAAL